MTSFLQEQIQLIFNRHKDEIDEISIIIPNRRAAVYIQKYLSELYKRPFFSPEILTINEWVSNHVEEKILTSTELLFILHEVHSEIETENPESFEKFALWGKTILNDFDEIDRYLGNPAEIFKNLKDIKALESWDLDTSNMGEAQQKFEHIWDQLPTYYSKLELKLAAMGATYSGKAYRKFYEQLGTLDLKPTIYFLGFNAVSQVEKMIMKALIDEKCASVVFDIDKFYFNNPAHEAGHFYSQICREWSITPSLSAHFNTQKKKVEIIETSQQVGQAKIAGAIVQKLLAEGEKSSEIALVLADESLLIPLTRSLPSIIETANITMGWPIKFSHLKGFLDIIFEFQFNFTKFNSSGLYHKTLVNFLEHPYTHEILGNKNIKETVQIEIAQSNRIFVEKEMLLELEPGFSKILHLCEKWGDNNGSRLKVFEAVVLILYETFESNKNRAIDLEIIYQFSIGFEKFKQMLRTYEVELSIQSFKSLFFQFWQGESLSFLGNPIEGLQIMGILETRVLDFKNLIVIGMNEGNLPKPTQLNSFIPRDLRLHVNLPVEEDRQAIFAHHFYRLLHRSSNVYLTYNSSADGLGSGEKSRFIVQLENELNLEKHELSVSTYSGEDSESNTADTIYYSTPEVQSRLDMILENGLSPSALNKLISCPLDFYYRYILKFEESDEVEESIESSTFGTKIHSVLEEIVRDNFEKEKDIFNPLEINILQKENTDKVIHQRLEAAYLTADNSKKFTKNDLKYGENKLSFDVSKRFIGSFLNQQLRELKSSTDAITPLHLEHPIVAEFKLNVNGQEKQLKIKGNADRIDKKGETYRILDYKSGSSKRKDLELKGDALTKNGLESLIKHKDKRNARQLLMYALMFRDSFPEAKKFSAGIISMVNISDWTQLITADGDPILSDDLLDSFKEVLLELIASLYNQDFIFEHNSESKYCQHCGN